MALEFKKEIPLQIVFETAETPPNSAPVRLPDPHPPRTHTPVGSTLPYRGRANAGRVWRQAPPTLSAQAGSRRGFRVDFRQQPPFRL
eukprot:2327075-Prymnesium_polylepis.1